jgi:predicted lipoprotein with Yx(FWY)xxD motif
MLNYKRFLLVLIILLTPILVVFAQDEMMAATAMLGGNDDLGAFLVDAEGMTLYIFTNDEAGISNCIDGCVENWPPLLLGEGQSASLAQGVPGLIGFITRADETRQVSFNGMPLYYFAGDAAAGDTNGQGRGEVWFVATTTDVDLGHSEGLGYFLVDANGMTLYTFSADTDGSSTCYDQCATNWPPLTVDGEVSVQPGLAGEFGVTERTDGTMQVTHNNQPLYFFISDSEVGMTNGQGIGDVWYVDGVATIASVEDEELGTILIGSNGMTLYLFTNDTEGESACVDSCVANWPPLTVSADEPINLAEGLAGEVSTIERTDGSLQVTFNGSPLYYFVRDVLPGDSNGQGRGDVWFIVNP